MGSPKNNNTPTLSPHQVWLSLTAPWCQQVQPIQQQSTVLINEAEPQRFLAYLWSGLLSNSAVILANPSWQQQEWQQVATQFCPDRVLGKVPPVTFSATAQQPEPGQILIATGGTSGKIKFVVHTWLTLTTAAQGFIDHFHQSPINSYCVLPLYHVSGLMQAMRVWLSGGRLIVQSFKHLEAGKRLIQPDTSWFISLVPTQLQRLLEADASAWLERFHAILLGGAPAWPKLLEQVRHLPLALTYGMSETAAQIATLLPPEFQQGHRSSGSSLPHTQISIHQLDTPQTEPVGKVGRIAIKTPSLGLGYWPHRPLAPQQNWFYPDDLGYLDQNGHLHVVGRHSQKIITGGENVFPTEVEAALLATELVSDAWVSGVADEQWGQAVAAVYVSKKQPPVTPTDLKTALKPLLSSYKHPKHWCAVDDIPRNLQGKVNRAAMMAQLNATTVADQD
ncbi:MAG: AMP-binding protein [Cyanobacteria bacterium P01_D01_bin.156]